MRISSSAAAASIAARKRPRDEDRRIATREQQRAAQVLLHHRPEHEAEQQRRRLAFELDEEHAEEAEDRGLRHVEARVVDRVDADRAEQQDGGIEHAVGHLEQLDPDADQRQVEHDQHQVADPHRRDQAPEQTGVGRHHLRAWLDVVDGHRADHQRHHGVLGNAERQQRNERRLRAGIVGRFRSGDALDRALAELRRDPSRPSSRARRTRTRRASRHHRAAGPGSSRCRCRAAPPATPP